MNIGFLTNQFDNRGVGDAVFKYAHYNEELLGNKSYIYSWDVGRHDPEAQRRFQERFGSAVRSLNGNIDDQFFNIDVLYHIKSGFKDGWNFKVPKYVVHSVFDNEPHGDVYATVSPWMGRRFNLPYVPHIVELPDVTSDLREELNIPEDAVVFGRHGGADSFDIPFVWETIAQTIISTHNVYFVFLNTDRPNLGLAMGRIRFLPPTLDPIRKRQFINTCDAMIHARSRGETFGLSVGEFAYCGKPVITYSESGEKAHLQELGQFALTYKDSRSLETRFFQVMRGPMVSWGYGQYTAENVMRKFEEVFLS